MLQISESTLQGQQMDILLWTEGWNFARGPPILSHREQLLETG